MVVNTKEMDTKNVYAGLVETYLVKNAFQEPKLEIKIIGEVLKNKSNENRYEEVMKWLSEKRPIQYYAGYTYTFDKKIIIDRNVMIPGPEMDIFINTAKKYMANCHNVMELCTGSGVIPVMLGMEYPDVDFYASDISDKALKVAQENINFYQLKNVHLLKGSMFEPFEEQNKTGFDMLISNPPYAKTGIIGDLIPQLKDNAPRISLDGGEDGLYFYRIILANAHKFLNKNGYIIFENGEDQSEELQELFVQNGFKVVEVVKDYIDIERFVVGRLEI